MKILRIFGLSISFFLLLGVVVSTRPIAPPPRRIESLSEKKSTQKLNFVRETADAIESAVGIGEMPEWVRSEAMRTVTNTSYVNSAKALQAWRQRTNFIGFLDERENRITKRPSPPAPEDPGEAMDDIDWTDDRRVNTDASDQQFHPTCCVGSDGTIYVAWCLDVDTENSWVYFSKSSDGGVTWSSSVLVDSYGINNRPRIACYGAGSSADVYITYTYWYNPSEYDYDIYCSVSNNGGSSFSTYSIRASSDYEDMSCVVTDDLGYVYVAMVHGWVDGGGCDPDEAEAEVVLYRSSSHGSSWSGGYYLTNYGGQHDDFLPALATYGGGSSCQLHFAWVHDVTTNGSNYDVYYKKITNAGGTPSIPSSYVSIASSSVQEYVIPSGIDVGPDGSPQITYTYSTASSGNGDIYYRRSTDGGASFQSARVITNRVTEETDAVIAVDAQNNPTVVWRDARSGNTDIYVSYSDDEGTTWKTPFRANQDATTANQYWPGIGMWSSGWQRKLSVIWWDERYDDGDVYFNGNEMLGVSLDVDYVPSMPLWPLPGFSFWAFEAHYDTSFTTEAIYRIWFDPEYSNDPLLDELWAGSSSSERWAVDNPGGWIWLSGNYWTPPSTGGSYICDYYHQFRVIFDAVKGNPPACDHTLPDVDINFESFGNDIDTTINDAVSCTSWVDIGTTYDMAGWYLLSPTQRWATNSPDTIGSVSMARIVQPYYYHQWNPIVLFVGPTVDNTVFTETHTQFGEPHVESGLYNRWEQWTDCGTTIDFSDTTVPEGWYAIDSTNFLCEGYSMRTIRYSNNTHVVVRNDFVYGQVIVDGTTVSSPDSVDWGPGSTHSIGAISPQTFGDTIRYIFRAWSDDGAFTHLVVISEEDVNFTALFGSQFKLDMEYTGATGGHEPTLTGEGWYWEDSVATITASEAWDSVGGVRYGFSHWETIPSGAFIGDSASSTTTIIMDRHYTVRAVYSVQYELTVNSEGGYGTPDPPVGSNWIDAGAHVCANAGSPDLTAHMYATGWAGTGPVPSAGSGSEACFYMSSSGSIQWLWADQLTLTVISTYGVPSPMVGVSYYDPGTYVDCSVETPFMLSGDTRAACYGYTGTSVIGSGSTEFVDFNIVEDCTLTWNWRIEYRLMIVNTGGYGEPLIPPVGENWFPSGSLVLAKVNSPDPPMVCIGFLGTPPVLPSSSPQDSIVFAMIAPATLTWQWAGDFEVYSLLVTSPDERGAPSPYGTTWWLPGSPITATVTNPWPDPVDEGIRWIVDNFVGSGSAPSGSGASTGTFYIWANSTIAWNWDDEYRLLIDSEPGYYGAPVPDTGENWYERGAVVSGSVTTPWEDSVVCTGYTGTGSAPASSGISSFSFALATPSSVTWHWDISSVSLNVMSDYGLPTPSVGLHHYAVGTEIDLLTNQYAYVSPVERWKCVGWTGTGSVPMSGVDTLVNVRLITDSSIRWIWERQFRLDVDNPGGYDAPVPAAGQHWFDAGTWVTCYITTNPYDTMYCVGFSGTGDCPSAWGVDEVSFIINQYSSIQWIWFGESDVNIIEVASEHGDPHPAIGTHYYPGSIVIDCYMLEATDFVGPGERCCCDGWTGTGSVPVAGADTSFSFTVRGDGTITWNWHREYSFEVQNPFGMGYPLPDIGMYWYPAGSEVTAEVTLNPDGTWACVGYSGWGSLGIGVSDRVSFTIDEPSGIEWIWESLEDVYILTVVSLHGHCDPPVGINYISEGSIITATAGPYDYDSDVVRHSANGWVGLGCVPLLGDTNLVTFTMDSDGTITWGWNNEFYLALDYEGCGSAVPVQTGEGWFLFRETTEVTTSTSIPDVGGSHYGFISWDVEPELTATVAHYTWPNTEATVLAPCTLIARYAPAVQCTLYKNPSQDFGGFIVDGTLYDEISQYIEWWGLGSNHRIEATSPDIGPGERYVFSRWNDAGPIAHDVGPITTPIKIRADYATNFALTIEKSPLHSTGFISVDGTEYLDSSNVSLWIRAGLAPTVGVSSPDYESSDQRFNWISWSDGGALNHLLEPMGAPVNLIANYNQKLRLKVDKSPPESYGWISIDDTLFEYTSSAALWLLPGGEHEINLSRIDVSGDSAYQFVYFDRDVSDSIIPKTVILDEPQSILAVYNAFEYILAIDVTPTIWSLGLQFPNYMRTMIPPELITVQNTGNINCDLGLAAMDTLSEWVCGCSNGMDKIVLRAHLCNDPVAPALFHPAYDCIRETINWATEYYFGPLGYELIPYEINNLWLQAQMPRASSSYAEQIMIIRVTARVTLY
ncbi:exo-alpha-sialidase [bacterium]|nr:exo-alpha-sialidase [bacterium]